MLSSAPSCPRRCVAGCASPSTGAVWPRSWQRLSGTSTSRIGRPSTTALRGLDAERLARGRERDSRDRLGRSRHAGDGRPGASPPTRSPPHATDQQMAGPTASPDPAVELPPAASGADESGVGGTWRYRLRAAWNAFVAAIGIVMGLLPHVLHHVSFLAGAALVAGSGGTALFAPSACSPPVPMLLRLGRRFGTWRAPAVGLLVFGDHVLALGVRRRAGERRRR